MRALRYIIGLYLVMLAMSASAQSNVVDEVVWVVGDEAILRSDVERVRNEFGSAVAGNPYCVIPEQLAIQKLFLHQATIDSIEVTASEITPYVEQRLNEWVMLAGSKEKLEEYKKMTLTQIREELLEQLKEQETVNRVQESLTSDIKITPAEVRRYFRDVPEDSLPMVNTQVEVEIIMLKPKVPQEEIDNVKEQLRGFAERVNTGSTTFSMLARMYSQDKESGRQGGLVSSASGEYVGKGELDPAFANVAFSLNDPSKVSKIVESEFGYHIIQLVDKRGDKIKCRHILLRPEVPQANIDTAMQALDSIAEDIRQGKYTFEQAVAHYSEDKDTRNNHGLLFDNESRDQSSRFEMAALARYSSQLARMVEGMQTGEISAPFRMINSQGKEVCVIAKLKSRIKAHRATITEDFQMLKDIVKEKRSEEVITQWIRDKQRSTYIRINEDWRDCEFQYPGWVK